MVGEGGVGLRSLSNVDRQFKSCLGEGAMNQCLVLFQMHTRIKSQRCLKISAFSSPKPTHLTHIAVHKEWAWISHSLGVQSVPPLNSSTLGSTILCMGRGVQMELGNFSFQSSTCQPLLERISDPSREFGGMSFWDQGEWDIELEVRRSNLMGSVAAMPCRVPLKSPSPMIYNGRPKIKGRSCAHSVGRKLWMPGQFCPCPPSAQHTTQRQVQAGWGVQQI